MSMISMMKETASQPTEQVMMRGLKPHLYDQRNLSGNQVLGQELETAFAVTTNNIERALTLGQRLHLPYTLSPQDSDKSRYYYDHSTGHQVKA